MSAQFFFDRMQRAVAMDAVNTELGKDCAYIREAIEWLDAYKSSLTAGKQKEFDKEYKKLETTLAQVLKKG